MAPKKKKKSSLAADVVAAQEAIASKGWERTSGWSVVRAQRETKDGDAEFYTLAYTCWKTQRDRVRKQGGLRRRINRSTIPGEPARWRTESAARMAMPKYIAAIEQLSTRGRTKKT